MLSGAVGAAARRSKHTYTHSNFYALSFTVAHGNSQGCTYPPYNIYTHPDTHPNAFCIAHPISHTYAPDSNCGSDPGCLPCSGRYRTSPCDLDKSGYRNTYLHTDPHLYSHLYCDTLFHSNRFTNVYAHLHIDSHPLPIADAYGYIHTNFYSHTIGGEMFLSIVIPVYNEAARLPKTMPALLAFLRDQPWDWEVILVDNGSQDETPAIAWEWAQEYSEVRMIRLPTRGKGKAVRTGMLASRGEWCFVADVDWSMPVTEIPRFLPPQGPDADIIIGSRSAPGAMRYGEPWHRHITGRVFNWMVQRLVLPGIRDSQCGFKAFRGFVARDIFRYVHLEGMAFDVEALFVARLKGYRIVELPIPWYFDSDSRVRLVRDSLRMAWDLLTIRWNAWKGVYTIPQPEPNVVDVIPPQAQ